MEGPIHDKSKGKVSTPLFPCLQIPRTGSDAVILIVSTATLGRRTGVPDTGVVVWYQVRLLGLVTTGVLRDPVALVDLQEDTTSTIVG